MKRIIFILVFLVSFLTTHTGFCFCTPDCAVVNDTLISTENRLNADKDGNIFYIRDGVSFTISPDWNVLYDDQVAKNAYYFSMATENKMSSGLISVVWLDYFMDLDVTLDSHKSHMLESKEYKYANVQFSEIAYSTFLGYKSRECHYNVISKNGTISGRIIVFNSAIKTISIFYQTSSGDKDVNDLLFRDFVLSFGVRED
ncbi:hypothetical protein K4L44_02330 [Halosquirtibacter laminarini]|uniref:Uncharacterized protein n=1 Tax=Halosquirtibacter laminarini TaxID=3374600 RepID=A0AC61NPA7_9BACT|nr:hypothetical protein K4L44_02330 [Prolixibacteraceae bacterium]